MDGNHFRAGASSSEVASCESSDAAEAHCDCCTTGRFDASEVARSPEEIPRRGPRNCINEDHSNPGGDCQLWNGQHGGEVQFGSRVVSCPTSPCDPSSRQAHRRHVRFHRTGEAERDLECLQWEGEISQARPCWQELQDPVAVLEAELSQAHAELAQLKGADPDEPCGPSVKRPCRTGEGRGCIPPMPILVPAKLRRSLPGRQQSVDRQVVQWCVERASRRVALVPLDGTPQSIRNMASGSVPQSFVPSRAGWRRKVLVQSGRTPVVDMTACDTEIDHDSDNSALSDAPPQRVWNEASVEKSDTDSLELDGESNTASLPSSVAPLEEEVVDSGPTNFTQHRREMSVAFREFDACKLRPLFECRAHVMKTVPFFLRGGFRAALCLVLEEISSGQERGDEQKQERGWKFFFLLPRMLMGQVPDVLLRTMEVVDRRQHLSSEVASARICKVARVENLAMMGVVSRPGFGIIWIGSRH